MMFGLYGHPVRQERIVLETWRAVVNMPAQPQQILADLNRAWIDDNGNAFAVFGESFDANAQTASQDLASDMPLVIGTNGHAMLLVGMAYRIDVYGRYIIDAVTVIDPWPANPRIRQLSASEWNSARFLARVRVL